MELQRAELVHERGLQARALLRADARVSAAGHLPLRHRTAYAATSSAAAQRLAAAG
jgi:hypothetical protein